MTCVEHADPFIVAARFESTGVDLVTAIVSSQDDWDAHETLHWLALDEWLRRHPDAPEAERFRARGARLKERHLRWERDLLGWVILVGRFHRSAAQASAT